MYILVGSVTTATRLKKVAEKIIGFPAGDNEIPIRRIYIERTVNGERVYDVVS